MKSTLFKASRRILGVASCLLFLTTINLPAATLEGCLPECGDPDTGAVVRHFAIAGSGLSTIEGGVTTVRIEAPSSLQPGIDSFTVRIFDGDADAADGNNQKHWDTNGSTPPVKFHVCSDPDGDLVCTDNLLTVSSPALSDNAWDSFPVIVTEDARTVNGNFSFLLHVQADIPVGVTPEDFFAAYPGRNSFAIGTQNAIFSLDDQVYSFIASASNLSDLRIIYPDWDGNPATISALNETDPTSYDGKWTFYFLVKQSVSRVETYDGDYDVAIDTDDWNISGLPIWATSGIPEGAHNGNPPDDNTVSFAVRSPNVRYTIVDPFGNKHENSEPSGDQEWEYFSIGTNSLTDDIFTSSDLPPGIYKITVEGLDLANLVSNRNSIICTRPDGGPCVPDECLASGGCGTGTPGYWLNHPEAWPVPFNEGIVVGGHFYTQAEALRILKNETSKDMRYQMFAQLVAAMLNVASFTDPTCIAETIQAANEWMNQYGPIPGGTPVRAKDAVWTDDGETLKDKLDSYNNGLECAPARD